MPPIQAAFDPFEAGGRPARPDGPCALSKHIGRPAHIFRKRGVGTCDPVVGNKEQFPARQMAGRSRGCASLAVACIRAARCLRSETDASKADRDIGPAVATTAAGRTVRGSRQYAQHLACIDNVNVGSGLSRAARRDE